LKDIITYLKNLINILNICGIIDGHNILTNILNKKVMLVGEFFNRKKFHRIVLQIMCDVNKILWNFCASQLGGVHEFTTS
jgi:hypothetical protein